jgi:NIMA (never in mitosis gene a)-related kinase
MSGHIEDYEVLNVIGTGSFSTCYKVQKKSNGHLYVWKAVGYGGMSEEKKQVYFSSGHLW